MIDDILPLIENRDFNGCISEIKNHNVNSIDIVNKLIYMSRYSSLKWFYINLKINGYIKI